MTLKYKNGKHKVVLFLKERVQQTGQRTPSLSLGSSCENRENVGLVYAVSKYLYKNLANSPNNLVQVLKVYCARTMSKWWEN